jgi:pteridine reductase
MNQPHASRTTAESPVALVTGSGRRLGNAVAHHLAARGYRLALHAHESSVEARQTADEWATAGTDAIALAADLRDELAVRRMIATARDHFGRIDALVNNAGVWFSKPLESVTADDVRLHFEINTLGTFICCQEVGLAMVGQPTGGAIVNVGDWATVRPYRNYAAYFAAKGSIPTLTRTFAVELASRNPRVRVNAVLPGPVLLPAEMSAQERQQVINATLVKHEGKPVDVAQAVLFLLENEFVTGVCLPVDGGRSVFCPMPGSP